MSTDNVIDLKAAQKPEKKAQKCPMCDKPSAETYKPFCSKRCADLDLGQWLGEGYRIPSDEVPGFDDSFGEED